jgi:hypothetical protein
MKLNRHFINPVRSRCLWKLIMTIEYDNVLSLLEPPYRLWERFYKVLNLGIRH